MPLTPELEKLQNIEERSGKFEGDIVLTNEQIDSMVAAYQGQKNAMLDSKRLWFNKTVPYDIAPGFSKYHFSVDIKLFNKLTIGSLSASIQIDAIALAVKDLNTLSCLKVTRRTTQSNYILVQV